jgi:hypothetical protein
MMAKMNINAYHSINRAHGLCRRMNAVMGIAIAAKITNLDDYPLLAPADGQCEKDFF